MVCLYIVYLGLLFKAQNHYNHVFFFSLHFLVLIFLFLSAVFEAVCISAVPGSV